MSGRRAELAQRKQLLVARLHLQRMETTLHAAELRDALRPTSLIGSAISQPTTLIALVDSVASLFGLRRFARLARLATVAMVVTRIVRSWRGTPRAAKDVPVAETPDKPL